MTTYRREHQNPRHHMDGNPIPTPATRSGHTLWFERPTFSYRIEFYALNGSNLKRIHYWRVYRSDNP